jgi:hypothetical protein
METDKTVQERNEKQTEIIHRYLIDVQEAKNFLKKSGHTIFSQQEFSDMDLKRKMMAGYIGLTGVVLGIALCKLMGW